jgi:hypothetical protein
MILGLTLASAIRSIQAPMPVWKPILVWLPARNSERVGTIRYSLQSTPVPQNGLTGNGTVFLSVSDNFWLAVEPESEVLASFHYTSEISQLAESEDLNRSFKFSQLSARSQRYLRSIASERLPDYPITMNTVFRLTPVSRRRVFVGKLGIGSTHSIPVLPRPKGRPTDQQKYERKEKIATLFGDGAIVPFPDKRTREQYHQEVRISNPIDAFSFDPLSPRSTRLASLAQATIELRNWLKAATDRLQEQIEKRHFVGADWTDYRNARLARDVGEYQRLAPKLYQSDYDSFIRQYKLTGATSEQEVGSMMASARFTVEQQIGVYLYPKGAEEATLISPEI